MYTEETSKALTAIFFDIADILMCVNNKTVTGWDGDLSSLLLLLHLIPPSARGREKPGKVSASQAEKHLVVFKKVIHFSNL